MISMNHNSPSTGVDTRKFVPQICQSVHEIQKFLGHTVGYYTAIVDFSNDGFLTTSKITLVLNLNITHISFAKTIFIQRKGTLKPGMYCYNESPQ